MDAEKIADKARRSIGKFCVEECKSYCCRKGHLILSSLELDLIVKKRKTELVEKNIVKALKNGNYSLFLGDYTIGCPRLNEYKCMIHKYKLRPLICKQFPIILRGKKIFISERCLAVKKGLLFPYITRIISMGYKLAPYTDYQNLDFAEIPVMENAKP